MAKVEGAETESTPEVLLDVLAGRSRALSLSNALGRLAALSAEPGVREQAVAPLLSSAPDPNVRRATAVVLGRIGSDEARQQLRSALAVETEPRVVASVGTALGVAGQEQDIPSLLSAASVAEDPRTVRRLRFAAGLVAHRLGLAEPAIELPPPTQRLSEPGGATAPVSARRATAEEQALVGEGLRREPVGLSGTAEHVHAIECGQQPLFVALNPDVMADLGQVQARKTLLGALLIFSVENQTTSPSALVLTTPQEGGCEVLVARITGELLHLGRGRIEGGRLEAGIYSVDTIGVPSVDLRVALDASQLAVEGVAETRARHQIRPRPRSRPRGGA